LDNQWFVPSVPRLFHVFAARNFFLWVSKIQNLSEMVAPPAIVTEIVAEMITLGLGNVRATRRCPGKRAHSSVSECNDL
jgi:hypothetical protein